MKSNQEINRGIYSEELNDQKLDKFASGLTIADNVVGVTLMILLLVLFF